MTSYPTLQIDAIAKRHGINAKSIADAIVNNLHENGILEDVEYGLSVKDNLCDAPVLKVCNAIKKALNADALVCDEFFAALDLVVMDDYDCPECGGELVEIREYEDFEDAGEYRKIKCIEYQCQRCGEIHVKLD